MYSTWMMQYLNVSSLQDGSLCHILQHDEIQGEYSWHKKGHQLALDIARGLAFLHSVKIVHR